VSEIAAIWVAGAAVFLLGGISAGAALRFTRAGREQEMSVGDVLKVLLVCVVFACAAYTLLTLVA
jgi:hypothetical protein